MSNKNELQQGPYAKSYTKTIKVSPIEITITEKHESTHVPPADCGCGGGSGISIGDLMGAAKMATEYATASAAAVPPTYAPPASDQE